MRFDIENNPEHRKIYQTAKSRFDYHRSTTAQQYWKLFGETHNMKVIIPKWQGPYPVVEALEFNTEADYVWFLLRYS